VAIDVDLILTKPISMVVGLQRAASKRGIVDFEVLLWAQEGGEEEGMEREREKETCGLVDARWRERKNMPHTNCQLGGKRMPAISKTEVGFWGHAK
jgi:hypothetical protein